MLLGGPMTQSLGMQHIDAVDPHVPVVEALPRGTLPAAAMHPPRQPIGSSLSAIYQYSNSAAAPLRIGVVVESLVIPVYMHRILQDIAGSNFARIVCAVVMQRELVDAAKSANRASAPPASAMLRLYATMMARRSRLTSLAADPMAELPADELIRDAQIFFASDAALGQTTDNAIANCDLDVLLMLGATRARLTRAVSPRYGVWVLRFGASAAAEGEPPLLRELMDRQPVSEVALEILHADYPGPMVLGSMVFATDFRLTQRNQFGPRWGSMHLVIGKLRELHQRGWQAMCASLTPAKLSRPQPLTNLKVASWLASELVTRGKARLQGGPQQLFWRVGLRQTDRPLCEDHSDEALRQFEWVKPPAGRYWADPFLIEHRGDTWLFVEEFNYALNRGQLACGRIDRERGVVDSRVCLDKPYHLSYPHVFEHGGDIFMIPESSANGTVDLYRATEFPFKWQHERTLLELRGVDATILHRQGSWWLFVTAADVPGHPLPTLLFTAPALDGKWTLHPASPICSDIRSARGAGAIFSCDGTLIRPSQDCTLSYGRQLKFNEIVTMDGERYRERERAVIAPDWIPQIVGTHTYNRAGAWEAIDVRLPGAG